MFLIATSPPALSTREGAKVTLLYTKACNEQKHVCNRQKASAFRQKQAVQKGIIQYKINNTACFMKYLNK